MTETIRFTRLLLEDLDIGNNLREVRLADGRVMLLQQIHPGNLPLLNTVVLKASAGAAILTATNAIKAGMRVMGVTTEVLKTLGLTNGITGFTIGDGIDVGRWGQSTGLVAGAQTDQTQFLDTSWPVYPTDTSIILSALGGLYDAIGQIEVTVHYFPLRHRRAG